MRTATILLLLFAVTTLPAEAGDLPFTARSALEKVPLEDRTIPKFASPVGITYVLPTGDESPPVCILGPVERGAAAPGASIECWTWFVEPRGRLAPDALRALFELENLEWLNLQGCTRLTDGLIDKLKKAMPECQVLGPRDVRLGPAVPAVVRPR